MLDAASDLLRAALRAHLASVGAIAELRRDVKAGRGVDDATTSNGVVIEAIAKLRSDVKEDIDEIRQMQRQNNQRLRSIEDAFGTLPRKEVRFQRASTSAACMQLAA